MTLHYVHGISLGRIQQIFGPEVKISGIIRAFHQIASKMDKAIPELIQEFRSSQVRHADETGWRTDGLKVALLGSLPVRL